MQRGWQYVRRRMRSRADVLEDKHTLCYVQACAVIYMALANGKSLANMNMQMFTYG